MNRRNFIQLAAGVTSSPMLQSAMSNPIHQERSALHARPIDQAISHFCPAWQLGTLDPSRNTQWSENLVQPMLKYVPIAPVYASLMYEGDRHSPSSYDNYQVLDPAGIRGEAKDEIEINPRVERSSATLFFDFGRTMPGHLEFEAEQLSGIQVTVQFGEAMQPTRTYSVEETASGRFRSQIPHGEWGSLRFAWIRIQNVQHTIKVRNVRAVYQIFPSNYIGEFHCSDTRLDYIWEMCSYSAHAVMGQPEGNSAKPQTDLQTLCLDRIDRIPWAGDSRIIQSVVGYCFGQYQLLREALDQQLPPGTRPIPDLQSIPSYTLDWALAVLEYFQMTGDSEHLNYRLPDIEAVISRYVDGPPSRAWMFFDWDPRIIDPRKSSDEQPEPLRRQTMFAFTGKYIELCRAAAYGARYIGKQQLASQWDGQAAMTAKNWRNSYPEWPKECGIHAITQLLLGGVLESADWQAAWQHAYADRQRRWTNTPYFGTYVLNALAQIGRYDAALEMICDYWGSMINAGATTTWEEWSPTTRLPVNAQPPQYGPPLTWGGLSLIQPSGSGPARWLMAEIAGIKPATPGFKTVQLDTPLCGLAEVSATVASPLGPISVHRNQTSEGIEVTYNVPTQCERVILLLPHAREYQLDGMSFRPTKSLGTRPTQFAPSGEHRYRIVF